VRGCRTSDRRRLGAKAGGATARAAGSFRGPSADRRRACVAAAAGTPQRARLGFAGSSTLKRPTADGASMLGTTSSPGPGHPAARRGKRLHAPSQRPAQLCVSTSTLGQLSVPLVGPASSRCCASLRVRPPARRCGAAAAAAPPLWASLLHGNEVCTAEHRRRRVASRGKPVSASPRAPPAPRPQPHRRLRPRPLLQWGQLRSSTSASRRVSWWRMSTSARLSRGRWRRCTASWRATSARSRSCRKSQCRADG